MSNFKLTYFDIQGVAEKVRLAFVLSGVAFEDERLTFPQWADLKSSSKYGQLPLLTIDGGEIIAQSGAMFRYIAHLGNGSLLPSDPKAELHMNEILGLSDDFDRAFYPSLMLANRPAEFGLPEDFAKSDAGKEQIRAVREKFAAEKLPVFLTYLQSELAKSGGVFFGGASPNLADCQILPQLAKYQAGFIDHIPTSVIDGHPDLLEWMARMRALPVVAAWYSK